LGAIWLAIGVASGQLWAMPDTKKIAIFQVKQSDETLNGSR
jgi:hypothetical protein